MNKILKHKRTIVQSLLALYLLSSFKIISPYIDYNLNQAYIINVLCENKDKPALQCEGKCYLSKELKKAAEESDSGSTSLNFNLQIEFFNSDADLVSSSEFVFLDKSYFTGKINLWHTLSVDKEAPPPKA